MVRRIELKYTAPVYIRMSIVTMEEVIVDVNVRLNQVVRQQFARTLSDVTMSFK